MADGQPRPAAMLGGLVTRLLRTVGAMVRPLYSVLRSRGQIMARQLPPIYHSAYVRIGTYDGRRVRAKYGLRALPPPGGGARSL